MKVVGSDQAELALAILKPFNFILIFMIEDLKQFIRGH